MERVKMYKNSPKYGFKKGDTPWNKGLKGYNNGHPNYYFGKSKNK